MEKINLENQESSTEEENERFIKRDVDSNFGNGEMLYGDATNSWFAGIKVSSLKNRSPQLIDYYLSIFKPVPHYIERYQQQKQEILQKMEKRGSNEDEIESEKRFNDQSIERIIKLSDPTQIEKYDQLVDEFNANLDRLKKEKDLDALEEFQKRLLALMKERKPKA